MKFRTTPALALVPLALLAACASSGRVDFAPVALQPVTMDASHLVVESTEPAAAVSSDSSTAIEFDMRTMRAPVEDSLSFEYAEPDMEVAELDMPYKRDSKIGKSYTQVKLGGFEGSGDLNNQDTGFYGELVFGRELIPFLAIEGVIGYLQTDGQFFDMWAVPVFVQGRVQVPILIFEPYAGLGLGGAYIDTKAPVSSPSGWAWGGNVFLGVEVGLGNLALGLEAKYIAFEELDNVLTVEGTSVFLSLKLPF